MFSRILSTNGVDVHHDLGVDMNCRAYRAGNPDAGGSGPAQSTHEITSGSSMPEEFHRNFGSDGDDGPPTWDGKGGVPGSPPPGFAASSNVGGATAGMAIHKSEGLVPFDDRCATNIPGPYAAGDALGSHMSGGIYIQIGSSLTGSAVQGAIAGEAAAEYASEADTPVTPGVKIIEIVDEILAPLRRVAGYGPAWVTQPLLDIMILSAEMKCGRH
jgi:succinate dehydrogenase/fumarate reductase flavoprotein subunit